MNNDLMFSSKTVEWETPQDFFSRLNVLFNFTLDAASTDENAKCEKHFTEEDDGLSQNWGGADSVAQSSIRSRYWKVG